MRNFRFPLSTLHHFHGNVYLRTCLFRLDCCQILLYMFFIYLPFAFRIKQTLLIFITKNQLCLFSVPNFYPFYVYHQFLSFLFSCSCFLGFFFFKFCRREPGQSNSLFSVAISFYSPLSFLWLMVCFYIPGVINILFLLL